ncbi:nuclear autoantigenic sperm protein isoform X2 [Dicentrarchus labrax]|uniref:Tetratricopeptide SHNi-TPR domain-containing protein n=1 Tax=Dicentrarchus labrax TaxID=13489 RepID=A0A8P4G2C6_DICLA|nr:nuclear autoantigenic sperm protein isoform X2 [Dicentrarchus labrax]
MHHDTCCGSFNCNLPRSQLSGNRKLSFLYLSAPTKTITRGLSVLHPRHTTPPVSVSLSTVSTVVLKKMPEEASSVEEKPCSSSSSSAAAAAADSSVDAMEEAKKLIGTGNKHLVMGDVVSAVSVFQDACSMLAAKYGDTADECGEAFFLCGKSLLELARMENSVLGNALEGVPEESEEEEQPNNSNIESANSLNEETRDELRKQVYDAMAEKEKTESGKLESEDEKGNTEVKKENAVAKSPVKHVNGSEEPSTSPVNGKEKSSVQKSKVNGAEKSPVAPVNGVGEGPTGSSGKETVTKKVESEKQNDEKTKAKPEEGKDESKPEAEQDGEPEDDEDDDDDDDDDDEDGETNGQDKEEDEVGNLQLAWEMLEVAKVIYKRKENQDDQLMAAQTYLKLGEVSAESGNYPQALEDFQECLALQLKHLPPHSRLLAETHYHVATTLCYMDQYSQAIQHYNSSIKVIETRLAMLQEVIAAAEGADGAAEEKNEMDELKQLLPDIREKVEDAKESQRTASAASQAIQQTLGGASTSSAFLSENGGPSSSSAFATASQIPVKSSDSASSSKAASDISHLVRKKPANQSSSVESSA